MRRPIAAILGLLALSGCATGAPPPVTSAYPVGRTTCTTSQATLSFDFDGASQSRCVIEGEREFSVLVSPEHAPPINPSPWYAFRYTARPGADVIVHLRYLAGTHRYPPRWSDGAGERQLPAKISTERTVASLALPAGKGQVSAQELIDQSHAQRLLKGWAQRVGTKPFTIGQSHGNRPIEAVRIGRTTAPRLVVLLGRQHPPEVTGAIALEAFVDRIAAKLAADPALAARYQFVIIPLLNPDGVALGHWRANLGGTDLNRDWGSFTQPETRAVKAWLDRLPGGIKPTLMLDFHSTNRNLFYAQGSEASPAQERFLATWLGGKEAAVPGYAFTIERRDANPGAGTTKNWFHQTYGIPAYTYEVGDQTDRAAIRQAAGTFAEALPAALETLSD